MALSVVLNNRASKQTTKQRSKSRAQSNLQAAILAEEKETARYHNIEVNNLRRDLKTAKQGVTLRRGVTMNKARKPVRRKSAPIVNMAPHKPQADMVPFVHITTEPIKFGDKPKALQAKPIMSAVDLGAFRAKKVNTGNAWADAVMNGMPSGDSRYPDPFTLMKTTQTVVSSTLRLGSESSSSTSGSLYGYTASGLFKGSPIGTYSWGALDAASEPYVFDWHKRTGVETTGQTWHNCGLGTDDFYTRPNGVVMDIIPRLVGPAHSIKIYAVPLLPFHMSEMTAQPAGWPVYPNLGLSGLHVSWGGREWEIDSTSKGVRLVCLPVDSRGFDFLAGATERSAISGTAYTAWSGWMWWANGMNGEDTFDIVVSTCEEVMVKTLNESTQYAWPATEKITNSMLKDKANNVVKNLATSGFNAFSIIDQSVDFTKKSWGIGNKLSSTLGTQNGFLAFAPQIGAASSPISTRDSIVVNKKPDEEKKDDDFQSIDKIERPTSVMSSSSSAAKVGGRKQ